MSVDERQVTISAHGATLEGTLAVPRSASGLVLFAHGSGSSRHSPRNRKVAAYLSRSALATLLFDLLTLEEERLDTRTGQYRFDIERLARRLVGALGWVRQQPALAGLRVGLFGSSTGAAAALVAAAEATQAVAAVVSRGGRPDLAGDKLPCVRCPTLLIVGERDVHVRDLNRAAMRRLQCPTRLEIVAGASHLFQEPAALDTVSRLARHWFLEHLAAPSPSGVPAH